MQSRPSKCVACAWSVREYSKVDFQLFGVWNHNKLCKACFGRCVIAFGEFECFESGFGDGKEALLSEDVYLLTNTGLHLSSKLPTESTSSPGTK